MAKVNFNSFSSLSNAASFLSKLNQNFSNLSTYLDNTLSRNGQSPNQMMANIDLNNNRILNLPAPVAASEPLRKQDMEDIFIDIASIDEIRQDLITETSNRISQDTALASLIGASEGPIYLYDYDTVAAVELATIAGSQNAIRTAGYHSAGDGGGALYKRVLTEPTHDLKIQSFDGAWWEIAERRIYVEMAGAKGDFNIETQTGTDDTPAINAVFNWARTKQAYPLTTWFNGIPNFGIAFKPGALYKTTSTINSTGLRAEGMTIWGNAACIYPLFSSSKPVVDGAFSKGLWVDKLLIFSDDPDLTSATAPSYGFTIGRIDDQDVSGCSFDHCQFRGFFVNSCFLNISGEIQLHNKCTYHNFMPTTLDESGYTETGLCVRISDNEVTTFTSEFAIPDPDFPRTAYFGISNNKFIQCHLQSDWGIPLHISNTTGNFVFENLYTYTHYGICNVLFDDYSISVDMQLKGHHENGPGAIAVVLFNTLSTNQVHTNFKCDIMGQGSNTAFGVLDYSNPDYTVDFLCSEISIGTPHPTLVSDPYVFYTTDQKWANFHGVLKIHAINKDSSLYDLVGLKTFKGQIFSYKAASSLDNIPGGYIDFYSYSASNSVHIVT